MRERTEFVTKLSARRDTELAVQDFIAERCEKRLAKTLARSLYEAYTFWGGTLTQQRFARVLTKLGYPAARDRNYRVGLVLRPVPLEERVFTFDPLPKSNVDEFVELYCTKSKYARCKAGDLYRRYRAWAEGAAASPNAFGRRLTALGFGFDVSRKHRTGLEPATAEREQVVAFLEARCKQSQHGAAFLPHLHEAYIAWGGTLTEFTFGQHLTNMGYTANGLFREGLVLK